MSSIGLVLADYDTLWLHRYLTLVLSCLSNVDAYSAASLLCDLRSTLIENILENLWSCSSKWTRKPISQNFHLLVTVLYWKQYSLIPVPRNTSSFGYPSSEWKLWNIHFIHTFEWDSPRANGFQLLICFRSAFKRLVSYLSSYYLSTVQRRR